ncbi:trypsin-like serine protease [Microbacterium aquilitoris]|uniref:trypsin-like serine protease n=1 Tax=Microbacterium aquilitoris TaxID=3067307 RepID=UPI0035D81E5A
MRLARIMLVALIATVGLVGCAQTSLSAPVGTYRVVALVNASAVDGDLYSGQFCGGVVMSPDQIVTASHCVASRSASTVAVVDGIEDLCVGRAGASSIALVEAIEVRPGTSGELTSLQLTTPLPGRASSESLPIPATGMTALGWGRASHGGIAPCDLRAVDLREVAVSTCTDLLPRALEQGRVSCTVPKSEVNTCDGDSGGPVYTLADGRLTSVAIVVSGFGCGEHDAGLNIKIWDTKWPSQP